MRSARNPRCPGRPTGEDGTVLVIALFMIILAMGMSISTLTYLAANRKKSDTDFAVDGQAIQLARAALTETTNWFRRQPAQPVTTFAPVLDDTADPAVLDTDDPEIGLVREFRIGGNLWGRYEVWRSGVADADPDRAALRSYLASEDITSERGGVAAGSMWRVRSVGYVFHRRSAAAAFDEQPNHVVAVAILESEIRRLTIALPAAAALCIGDGNRATINTYGRVSGGDGGGIAYPQGSGRPNQGPAGANRVTGTPATAPIPDYDDSLETVFGSSFDELAGLADFVVTRDGDFPSPVPGGSLIVADVSSLHFDGSRPLNGSGIVVVRGNVVIGAGSASSFSGILYVDGNLQVRQPSEIRGSVVVTGTCTVQGSSDYATLIYDAAAVSSMQLRLSRYRSFGPIRRLPSDR